MPEEIASSEPIEPLKPQRAIVTPRARREGLTAAVSLQSLIEPIIARGHEGLIEIVGPPGCGKSTALSHLRAVLPEQSKIEFCEDEPPLKKPLSIVARRVRGTDRTLATFFLAEWTIDDCMEYLAAVHREQVQTVLMRLSEDPTFQRLDGSPQLIRCALDRMAEDESIDYAVDALRIHLEKLMPGESARDSFQRLATRHIKHPQWPIVYGEMPKVVPPEFVRLFAQMPVKRIFAADRLVNRLKFPESPDTRILPAFTRRIFDELVSALRRRPQAIEVLNNVFRLPNRQSDSMAASLLLAVDPNWRICAGTGYELREATLAGAEWSGIDLQEVKLASANFSHADLSKARLNRAFAQFTCFIDANLSDANLAGIDANNAMFVDANLSGFDGVEGKFERADFSRANLENAFLIDANFNQANLTNANLSHASMHSAWLMCAIVEGTNFSHADLTRIACCDCDFRESILDHTNLTKASMLGCNLEGMEIADGMFEFADLSGAYLTGSRMPRANFHAAKLCSAGLADIEWENADLRDADFTNASFHMGSTRCGLVDSDLASEGTRTGFYTDDFTEQEFRAPEEIRKANLCGADLRGAKVAGCDFYLVDLRNAKYTQEQAKHFAKCGAILRSRVT